MAVLLGACSTTPQPTQPRTTPQDDAAAPNDGNEFVVAETMNDTWNTVGQILVGLEGVSYGGRAQMMGLYFVGFRGESFLIRTQALLATGSATGVRTRVDALDSSGAPLRTPATAELLGILARRVPVEAPGYRQATWPPAQQTPSAGKNREK